MNKKENLTIDDDLLEFVKNKIIENLISISNENLNDNSLKNIALNSINFKEYISNKLFMDLGNSNAKIFVNDKFYSIAYNNLINELYEIYLLNFYIKNNTRTQNIEIYLSNVKKIDLTNDIKNLSNEIFINFKILVNFKIIDVKDILTKNELINNFDFSKIKGIGTDRLLGLFLGYNYFKCKPVITIDFGTAITINVIDKSGNILGGLIMPGLFLQLNSLNINTAGINLNNKDVIEYLETKNSLIQTKQKLNTFIGTNTQEAVINGIFINILGAISNFINSHDVKVLSINNIIFTGSYSKIFYNYFQELYKNTSKNKIKLHYSELLNIFSILLLSKFKI